MILRRVGWLCAVVALLLGPLVLPVRAAIAEFGTPTAESVFGTGITFLQPVTFASAPRRVEILLQFPGDTGPLAIEGAPAPTGPQTLRDTLLQDAAQLYPNTTITARWRVTPASGPAELGPPVTVLYADTTRPWKTLDGTLIRLHWYSGSEAFARQALAVGEEGVRKAADFLGVTETQPIDFFVYPDGASFCPALLMGPTCNVAGRALSQNRTMFGRIAPSDVSSSDVTRIIPHELTHLVFNTATNNPYARPADWLNEGLATYLTEGNSPFYRGVLGDGEAAGTLQPLEAYTIAFPPQTLYDRFMLAYAESVSAVDFMVRTYGKSALAKLVNSYASGRTDDEAFTSALGVDVAGFEAAWLADIGVTAPKQYGPQPAPTGPVPPGWGAAASPASASPAPSQPTSSPAASGTPGPSATPTASSAPGGGTDNGAGNGAVLLLIVVGGLLVGAALGLIWRRRRRARETAAPWSGGSVPGAGSWAPPPAPPYPPAPPGWAPPPPPPAWGPPPEPWVPPGPPAPPAWGPPPPMPTTAPLPPPAWGPPPEPWAPREPPPGQDDRPA